MKNARFLNEDAIDKFLRTNPDKDKLIAKLDRSISYWRNYVRKRT